MTTSPFAKTRIPPGDWVGVLGGGQLGRMFAQAAQRLGYHVAVFESEVDSPAAQVADRTFLVDSFSGQEAETAAQEMARLCGAVTLEFENVPASLVRLAAEFSQTNPDSQFLEVCQDRVKEKQAVTSLGCPTTPFLPIANEADAKKAVEQLGLPLVLKTTRSGYDGKGQRVVRCPSEMPDVLASFHPAQLIAEQWIDYTAEVSMITARNLRGQVVHYPLFENDHANHILDVTQCPARADLQLLQPQAEQISRRVAEAFSVVGLFCIEFFVTKGGRLLVNEIAPRPHNSGHLTIEAFDISQFEMQVRAICNLPLRKPVQHSPAAMANLLGDLWSSVTPNWAAVLEQPQTYLHLYGKSAARVGRKMGHITVLATENAASLVRAARQSLGKISE